MSTLGFRQVIDGLSQSNPGTPLIEFVTTPLTVGLLTPMTGIGRVI